MKPDIKGKRVQLEKLLCDHERYRRTCINLIASENVQSPQVKELFLTDLAQRYGNYPGRDAHARKYRGNRYIETIEEWVAQLAKETFDAPYVELRALSGHIAGCAVMMGIASPGDLVLELGPEHGGHCMAKKMLASGLVQLRVHSLPFDPNRYNVHIDRTIQMLREYRPRLVILGSSNFLFPHPVAEIAEELQTFPETVLIYDGSHVMGMIAAGIFQDPLGEGAQVMFGSTHKTLAGPQGGIILSISEPLMTRISNSVYPALISNHHLARLPALGVALLEIQEYGETYLRQTVANARALAEGIQRRGVVVVAAKQGFTQSHTILMQVPNGATGGEIADRLEGAGIITTPVALPCELGRFGIRLGTQELTRYGARESDMEALAKLIVAVVRGQAEPAALRSSVQEYAAHFHSMRFTLGKSNNVEQGAMA
jgi:glycine hydroxymethyltransferase